MVEARDIDLVLLTGAGASRDLAPQDPFPLMGEWSAALEKHLADSGTQFLDAVDLRGVKDGHEFELRLGRFLQQVQSFRTAKSLMERTTTFPGIPQQLVGADIIAKWYEQVDNTLRGAVDAIHGSLVKEFGKRGYRTTVGATAYTSLLHALGMRAGSNKWVYATTNYDRNGESILSELGYHPDWGGDASPRGGSNPFGPLSVDGLVSANGARRVPILHLHGCVGWFTKADGSSYFSVPDAGRSEDDDIPIIMLPDPDKKYEGIDIVTGTWNEFRHALRRTKSIFILGHSLNDESLMDAIREDVQPVTRIAIGVNGTGERASDFGPGGEEVAKRGISLFGEGVVILPIRFGSEVPGDTHNALRKWIGDCAQLAS